MRTGSWCSVPSWNSAISRFTAQQRAEVEQQHQAAVDKRLGSACPARRVRPSGNGVPQGRPANHERSSSWSRLRPDLPAKQSLATLEQVHKVGLALRRVADSDDDVDAGGRHPHPQWRGRRRSQCPPGKGWPLRSRIGELQAENEAPEGQIQPGRARDLEVYEGPFGSGAGGSRVRETPCATARRASSPRWADAGDGRGD